MDDNVRIDKWLWSVRIYKTRNQATIACRSGKIRIGGNIVKPSFVVKPGEIIEINIPPLKKLIRVLALLDKRVSAKLVENFVSDVTPPEEYQRIRQMHEMNFERRERGTGRPTKKERRDIDGLKGEALPGNRIFMQ